MILCSTFVHPEWFLEFVVYKKVVYKGELIILCIIFQHKFLYLSIYLNLISYSLLSMNKMCLVRW